jgi:phosphate:Na+ symporter
VPDISRPLYLNAAVDDFPETLEGALRKEVLHLYDNAVKLILHGLNLHREDVFAAKDIGAAVRASRTPIDLDIADGYERRVKTLYDAIVEFSTRMGGRKLAPDIAARVDALRDLSGGLVRAVKSVKHIRKNVLRYTTRSQGAVTELYDDLRTEVARIVVAIRDLALEAPDDRSVLWLDQEAARIEANARSRSARVGALLREKSLAPTAATSFLNDASYADAAMRELVAAARAYYAERDRAVSEVETLLALDEDEVREAARRAASVEGQTATEVSQKAPNLQPGSGSGPH